MQLKHRIKYVRLNCATAKQNGFQTGKQWLFNRASISLVIDTSTASI